MTRPVAVLAYYNVNHTVSGGPLRVNGLLRAIGQDRVLLLQPRAAHPGFRSEFFLPDFGRRRVGINWGMFNFFWPPTARAARRLVADARPSCIVLNSIWAWAPFARRGAPCPAILDSHNVDAVAIAERFGPRHPFTRLVARWEARVLRSMERVFACSEVDRRQFVERYGLDPDRVRVVPNGAHFPADADVAPGRLDAETEGWLGSARVLLFVGGKLDYPPNAEGFAFVRDRLVPELERRRPGAFRVLAVGAPIPGGPLPQAMRCTGRVPDLAPYLRRADVCLAPIFSGSGTRLKILDSLAWGKATVATPKGAEGIDCSDGQHLLLAEGDAFADAVCRLADDPALAARLGRAGRERIRDRYAWPVVENLWREGLRPWL